MAGEFLRSHGIDIDAVMARIQNQDSSPSDVLSSGSTIVSNVSLPKTSRGSRWDVVLAGGRVSQINSHKPSNSESATGAHIIHGHGALLAPSFCHPHVHIDKAYLLSHPKYSDLQIESGDFNEAMSLTGKAKAQFSESDLLERGQRVIDESIEAGVTHMRAFVEVDAGVGTKCLDAGVSLKETAEKGSCTVQICAFAQLPLFSSSNGDEDGKTIRSLMEQAVIKPEVGVIGSTPYVESDREKMERNVDWMIELSAESGKHLDFHLDYHLDSNVEPMVWYIIKMLKAKNWRERTKNKTVVLGHCTRLTLFTAADWRQLRDEIVDLPVSFVGLPTSDLFMMRTPERTRGTLNVPELIQTHGLNFCLGINNIGNAFTPHGSCDPLTLACNGVGIYQAGTEEQVEVLYECVSTRARRAIGFDGDEGLSIKVGDAANLVLFGNDKEDWRTRKTVSDAVYLYDHCRGRRSLSYEVGQEKHT